MAGAVTIFRLDGTGCTADVTVFATVSTDVTADGCSTVVNLGGGGGLIKLSFGVGGSTFATTTGRGDGAGGSRRIISSV